MTNYHLSGKTGKYKIKKEGSKKYSKINISTKKEAEKLAKKMCENSGGGEVKIHSKNGKINDSDTVAPGNDPCPPKDKVH
ncbi:DUF2188 domain-containing protein [Candidatus Vampirococcus lugosii]|uniref:DUF2188 domain-containing protein n=1 Tax=Candidatus Vampirococcus lugosii TaxID=2789015 RepID=A0ABS5QLJ9_9BACT|nr:DUF2188 domain-containing protein [Candidatus Vampirococcus lugosii]MBS8122072.1 hypothetical protein [Candidatus Vampirococcus lugosii]